MRIQTNTFQEDAPDEVIDSRRILKVDEYLGGKTVQKRAQDKLESLRDYVEALLGEH